MTQLSRATVQGEVAIFWSDAASKASKAGGENRKPVSHCLTEVHPVIEVKRSLGVEIERLPAHFMAFKYVDVC